jgi:hypothetical protein
MVKNIIVRFDSIAEAESNRDTAAAELERLRALVVDGDATITGTQIERARAAVEMAGLRVAAAHKRANETAAHDHASQCDVVRVGIASLVGDLNGARDAYTEAVAKLHDLITRLADYRARRYSLVDEAQRLDMDVRTAFAEAPDVFRMDYWNYPQWAVDEAEGKPQRGQQIVYTRNSVSHGHRHVTRHHLHTDRAWRILSERDAAELETTLTKVAGPLPVAHVGEQGPDPEDG